MPVPALARSVLIALPLLAFVPPAAAQADDWPRLRPASPAARRMIEDAAASSETVRRLMNSIDRSDLIVYVQLTGSPGVQTAATTWVATTTEGRYLRVLINVGTPRWSLVPLLAHELQHVVEIAADPGVRGYDGIRMLYARIGTANADADRFETETARQVEAAVRNEVAQHHAVARRARPRDPIP